MVSKKLEDGQDPRWRRVEGELVLVDGELRDELGHAREEVL